MKLAGIRHRGHLWIAVQLGGTVSSIAEVDDFYSDPHRYRTSGKIRTPIVAAAERP